MRRCCHAKLNYDVKLGYDAKLGDDVKFDYDAQRNYGVRLITLFYRRVVDGATPSLSP